MVKGIKQVHFKVCWQGPGWSSKKGKRSNFKVSVIFSEGSWRVSKTIASPGACAGRPNVNKRVTCAVPGGASLPYTTCNDKSLIAWHWSRWDYLQYKNLQVLQSRLSPAEPVVKHQPSTVAVFTNDTGVNTTSTLHSSTRYPRINFHSGSTMWIRL